MIRYLYWS